MFTNPTGGIRAESFGFQFDLAAADVIPIAGFEQRNAAFGVPNIALQAINRIIIAVRRDSEQTGRQAPPPHLPVHCSWRMTDDRPGSRPESARCRATV